jgi:hypothetical protein
LEHRLVRVAEVRPKDPSNSRRWHLGKQRFRKALNDRIGLLTGQSLPILIVSGKVCLQVPILPTFTQVDAMLCNWSC